MRAAYDRMLAAYYDRMQEAYDRMQVAYDRMHPACRLHTIGRRWNTLVLVVIYKYL